MSKFIQSRYEEAVLELRSIPFTYTNYTDDYRGWTLSTRVLLHSKHYDIINSLYAFFQYEGYDNWKYDDFFDHIKRVAFEKNWRGVYMYGMYDFVHPDKKSRWFRHTNYYRHKRSYQRKPDHQKKEKCEPRWSDSKKPWKREYHNRNWKKHAKKTSNRELRNETRRKMFNEDYDSLPCHINKTHWWDYW
jgi:hypothetical protein